jgi:hypothetical protein
MLRAETVGELFAIMDAIPAPTTE